MSYYKIHLSHANRSSICIQLDPNSTTDMPKPCMKRKASLLECVKYGISIDKATPMSPEDLGDSDLRFLLQKGVSREIINHAYGLDSQPRQKKIVNH